MIEKYLSYFSLIFWGVHSLRRIFFGIYFIQLKEYRTDRLWADKKRFLNFLFSNYEFFWIILISFLFFPGFRTSQIIKPIILFCFILLGTYAIVLAAKKLWKFPKFTKKTTFLFLILTLALLFFAIIFLKNDQIHYFIFASDLFLPIVILVIAGVIQVPIILIKGIIYKKARKRILDHKNLTVVGITGSYGKTSTKEFLCAILSKKFNVLKTEGNNNTEISIAQTIIKKLNNEHEIFVVEMAAYKRGEIKKICEIVKPKIGIVTGVNEQHLGLFGSMKNLLSAEGGGELINALGKEGVLILNGDNKYCLDLSKKYTGEIRFYNASNQLINSDLWATEIETHKEFISFLTLTREKALSSFKVNVLGGHNVQNLLAAILVAKEIGMSFEEISEACKGINQKMGGIILKRGRYGINIVDSSYSSNPDGVLADLDYLSIFPNKKAIVMPCLIELGKESSKVHEKIGRKIAEICDLAIITSKDYFKDIERGFNELNSGKKKIVLCDKPENIFSLLTLTCKAEDAVLLEGRVPKELIKFLLTK